MTDPPGRPPAPPREALREGVREGIASALAEDQRRSGAPLARRLAAAGAVGIAGAVGLTLLFSGRRSNHSLHVAVCGALWAGLLVECFAFALLRIQTPRIELAQAAVLGLVGLALAAGVALACPDLHLGDWWASTALGAASRHLGGALGSAFCLGLCSAAVLGLGASLVVTWRGTRLRGAAAPAAVLTLLLGPAALLQGTGASSAGLALWAAGALLGGYLGVWLVIAVSGVLAARAA